MIDKFNFYDVYGYFLPGLALIGVLWLPFGLIARALPTAEWGSAIATVALAYFLGHLMLYISTKVLPSFDIKKSTSDRERYPSATLLDSDSDLSKDLRQKIASAVNREFQLDVHVDNSSGDYDKDRNDAFFLARQQLILQKVEGYAEQFQGMYSLARGLALAFAVATTYYLGWAFSGIPLPHLLEAIFVLLFLSSLLLVTTALLLWWEERQQSQTNRSHKEAREREQRHQRCFAGLILLMFFGMGCFMGLVSGADAKTRILLALASAISPAIFLRCYMQYRFFTVHFAITVWRDFTAYVLSGEKQVSAKLQFE